MPGDTMRALFIGNSFTARNDLPGMIARMAAAAAGEQFNYRLISAGGASLRRHWNGGVALREIQSGGYDRVVLQEQSTLPIKNAVRMHENVRLFDDAIRAAGSRLVLYMTWARRSDPESQAQITNAYQAIGSELGAAVIPAGLAWESVLRLHPDIVLHDRDGSHPTLAGTYLAACAAFAVLFGRPSTASAPVDGLSAKDADILRRAAGLAVSGTTARR